jgi:MoaA/NifB/PqqE/SkfB family radical SAM enzyme
MIGRLFADTYKAGYELGMMLTILSNGSRLFHPKVLELLTRCRPHRITLSVYGATEAGYDGLTRRKGAFRLFQKGLHAGHEAGLPLALSMIVTRHNAHEVPQMRALAERLALPMDEYVNMVPTTYGGAETLPAQSAAHLRKRKVFSGCNAGHTFFHVDPHGRASICKVGRETAAARRMLRLPAAGDLRYLHAPCPALPQGRRAAQHLLPAPRKEGDDRMNAVFVAIETTPAETDEIEIVDDLDVLSESDTCSCSAGDDNPF